MLGLNSSYSHEEHMRYMNVTCQVVLELFSRAKTSEDDSFDNVQRLTIVYVTLKS